MATALLTISAATGKMTAATVTLAKRIARTASPRIRPISVNDDEEWFVMFMPSLPFRDLMQDPVIINSLQYAWDRGRDNPLFTAGDIHLQRRDHPRSPGNAGHRRGRRAAASMSPCRRCAARRRLGVAWAQRMKSTTNTRDYGYMHGVGIQEMRGIGKLRFRRRSDS